MSTLPRNALAFLHQQQTQAPTAKRRGDFHVYVAERLVVVKEQTAGGSDPSIKFYRLLASRLKRMLENERILVPPQLSDDGAWYCQTGTYPSLEKDYLSNYVSGIGIHHRHQSRIDGLCLDRPGMGVIQEFSKQRQRFVAERRNHVELFHRASSIDRTIADDAFVHDERMRSDDSALVVGVMHDLTVQPPAIGLSKTGDRLQADRLR